MLVTFLFHGWYIKPPGSYQRRFLFSSLNEYKSFVGSKEFIIIVSIYNIQVINVLVHITII